MTSLLTRARVFHLSLEGKNSELLCEFALILTVSFLVRDEMVLLVADRRLQLALSTLWVMVEQQKESMRTTLS